MKNIDSKIVHAGLDRDPHTGASSVPLYRASTYHQADPFNLGRYDYARSGNPTRGALEKAIAELEGGVAGFAFSSGMAATSSVLLMFRPGDHIILSQDIYGGTFRAVDRLFSRWGLDATFVDTTDPDNISNAVKKETRAVFIESPSNPLLKITDLKAVVKIAKEHNLISITDGTFTTPVLQRPLELGFDVVIHSATKFINGHSDVLAGLVAVGSEALAKKIGFVQNAFGAVLGVDDSWLVLRGLKTLPIRIRQQQKTAEDLAHWFAGHHEIIRVYYPGLEGHQGYEVHKSQASGGGCVLSVEFSSEELAEEVLRNLRLPLMAVSLGGVETIVTYPVTMSHAAMPPSERALRGISGRLIRISAGLESAGDIIEDFGRSIDTARRLIRERCTYVYDI